MYTVFLSLLGAAVLTFCVAVILAVRTWPKLTPARRAAALLLLLPHFALVVCIVVAALSGNAPQGSYRFNDAFAADVFMVFILPVPALLGTMTSLLVMFVRPRPGR